MNFTKYTVELLENKETGSEIREKMHQTGPKTERMIRIFIKQVQVIIT